MSRVAYIQRGYYSCAAYIRNFTVFYFKDFEKKIMTLHAKFHPQIAINFESNYLEPWNFAKMCPICICEKSKSFECVHAATLVYWKIKRVQICITPFQYMVNPHWSSQKMHNLLDYTLWQQITIMQPFNRKICKNSICEINFTKIT